MFVITRPHSTLFKNFLNLALKQRLFHLPYCFARECATVAVDGHHKRLRVARTVEGRWNILAKETEKTLCLSCLARFRHVLFRDFLFLSQFFLFSPVSHHSFFLSSLVQVSTVLHNVFAKWADCSGSFFLFRNTDNKHGLVFSLRVFLSISFFPSKSFASSFRNEKFLQSACFCP